jgi:hypothetical protein
LEKWRAAIFRTLALLPPAKGVTFAGCAGPLLGATQLALNQIVTGTPIAAVPFDPLQRGAEPIW